MKKKSQESNTRRRDRRLQNHSPTPKEVSSGPVFVTGLKPVSAMLARTKKLGNSGNLVELLVLQSEQQRAASPALAKVIAETKDLGVTVRTISSAEDFPIQDVVHQRVCLVMKNFPVLDWPDFERLVKETDWTASRGIVGCVVDQIQDPRNFGAILRSAAFFRQHFVIFAKDRQAQVTPLVLKTAAGGASEMTLVRVTNLNRAVESLKEMGLWIVGASCDTTAQPPERIPRDRPYVMVLGNEEKGIRREMLQNCDYRTFIPGGSGTLDSLNVSVAAGILFHSFSTITANAEGSIHHDDGTDRRADPPFDP